MSMDISPLRESSQMSLAHHFAKGALTSFCNISIFHPLFTIKTLAMAKLPINFKHLYAGYMANLVCDITNQGFAFFSFAFFEKTISRCNQKPLTEIDHFIGGLFAGAVSSPLLSSLERVMIIQQVLENKESLGKQKIKAQEIIKQILKKEGPQGFLKGLSPTIGRESINSCCFFGLSKFFNYRLVRITGDESHSKTLSYLLAGAVAGLLTTPFDLIKTRMQQEISPQKSSIKNQVLDITSGKFKNVSKLYVGALPRITMLSATMLGMGFFAEKIQMFKMPPVDNL